MGGWGLSFRGTRGTHVGTMGCVSVMCLFCAFLPTGMFPVRNPDRGRHDEGRWYADRGGGGIVRGIDVYCSCDPTDAQECLFATFFWMRKTYTLLRKVSSIATCQRGSDVWPVVQSVLRKPM